MKLVNPKTEQVTNFDPIDAKDFLADGWVLYEDFLKSQREKVKTSHLEPPKDPSSSKETKLFPESEESREDYLKSLDWRELKAISKNLGIRKEEGESYEDLIPKILEAEGGNT